MEANLFSNLHEEVLREKGSQIWDFQQSSFGPLTKAVPE